MQYLTPRSRIAAALTIVSAIVLAGCSSGTAASTTSSTSTTLPITTTTVHYVPHYLVIAGHRVLMPTEAGHEPITAANGIGQNVVITKDGFEPHALYAKNKTPIVYTNLTAVRQVVRFYDFPDLAQSPPISPGMSWSFRYDAAIDLGYGNASGSAHGLLYIGTCPPNCG
jgi:hypothetical protein